MSKTKINVESKEVKILEKQILPVVAKASKIVVIKNDEDLGVATEVLSQLNKYNDSVKTEKKKLTEPANATLKAIKALFLPLEEKVVPKIEALREAMSVYQTEKADRAREEEMKIANRVGEGKGKLKVETAMRQMGEVEKPVEKVATDSGSATFRPKNTLEITDAGAIPREYLIVNEGKVLEALEAGIEVAGAKIKIIMVPVNRR